MRIVVLPEYGLNGAWEHRSVEEWIETAVEIPCKWTDLLAEKAKQRNVYIAANLLEKDPTWPGRFFNTSFIVDPQGQLALKHWKHIHNSFVLPYTTPADVYDEFIRRYGQAALFPVLDTPIGKLSTLTCVECTFPEFARCNAFNGAEVILHCTSEFQGPHTTKWNSVKVCRAMENQLYWASANVGLFLDAGRGLNASRGNSLVVAPDGDIVGTLELGEATLNGRVDINLVRHLRRVSTHATLRNQLVAREYLNAGGWPLNRFLDEPIVSLDQTRGIVREETERLYREGILVRPPGSEVPAGAR